MSTQMTDDEIRKIAVRRVRAKQGFFTHLIVYVIVNLLLVSIWAIFTRGILFWPAFTMAGWGIGLLMHGLKVFVSQGDWERNEIEKEVRRLKKNSGQS
jgi:hypothetical protein